MWKTNNKCAKFGQLKIKQKGMHGKQKKIGLSSSSMIVSKTKKKPGVKSQISTCP